ncbi:MULTISPECIES: phage antirepressor N-terminal domain-containing protein [unclassified Shinella]|uniref:phage antirepressor N-terminal domain-containing protein n=1 Tax=unclassified Shinella TaxID=2643062 RepID=UPI0009E734EE|nr:MULTISPECIES: phage antirepressor N-terminal domain-containing protein [unclassified Shinella]
MSGDASVVRPQPGPQTNFLASPADIAIYGGSAGGGKTWALLMEPLRHIANSQFGAVFFRRTLVQVRNEGGLWNESEKLYPCLNAKPKVAPDLSWTFPSGSSVSFAHLEHDKTVSNWQGSQIPLICFDDPILSEGMCVMHVPFGRGGAQEAVCLKLELVNGWLFTVDTSRIKDEAVREKVIVYQRECYSVLAKHFAGKHAGLSQATTGENVDDPQENESVKLRTVNESRQVFGTQAAAQLWFRLGLPVVPAMLHDPRQLNLLDYSVIKSASAGAPT